MTSVDAVERRFDLLVASVKDYAIFLLDAEGRVATWNEGARLIKGYSRQEIVGRHISTFYTPEDIAHHRPQSLLETARRAGRVEDEGWRVRKDGSRFWADVVITSLADGEGARGFIKVTRDLTSRKEAEDKLKRSEESLSATLYSIGDAVLATDEKGRVTRINPVAARLTGWSERDAVGRPLAEVFNIINEETRAPAPNPVERVLAEGVVVGLANHTALISRDGSECPIADSGAPIRAADGVTLGAVLVFRDVSKERQAEEELRRMQADLRRSEESLRTTLYSIGDGVLATDEEARVTRVNPVAERLTGWRESEAIGHPITEVFDIVNEETRAKAVNPVARVLAEGVVVGLANHTALRSRDGSERPIADSGAPILDSDGKARGAVLVFRDVSAEKAAEDALRQSEQKLRLMIASVHDCALYMLDPNGRVISWNPGAERIKGYRAEEIVGETFSRFFTPEDVAAGAPARALELARRQGQVEEEGWRLRKDGSRFWAHVAITPVRDASNALVGFVKVTRDLTERRRAEDERLKLVQTQEAVRLRDEFLSVAAHELRTPLTALLLQLQNIAGRVAGGTDAKLATNVDRARRIGTRLGQLIETLLDVSRISAGKLNLSLEPFDLGDAAREVTERLRDSAQSARCELQLEVIAPIQGRWDRLRIEQLLTNLITNSIKYAAGQPIRVVVSRDGDRGVVEVRDRGPGIPETDLSRIFERFETGTPDRHYGGIGLGLYIAREIAEAHHGTITASNLPTRGACFTAQLPLDSERAARGKS